MKVAENVEPSQILYYVQAMVNTFLAYGNYENRGKARTRYMQEKLGSEGYVKAFLEKLEEVKKNEKLHLNLAVSGTEKQPTVNFRQKTNESWHRNSLDCMQ